MALHPQARQALAESAGQPKVWETDIEESRAEARRVAAEAPGPDVAEVVDVDADGVRCRLYRPAGVDGDGASGVVLHLHGGGFVFHDIDVHDAAVRRLANATGLAVLSIDYRRPPEHRFPAAPDDVDTVLRWLEQHAAQVGLEGPAYVHGDSAGGNLALVAALRNPGRFRAVALTYPFLDPDGGFDSFTTDTDGFDPREARWYWEQYAAFPEDLQHPDLAPLRSDRLGTLPPTLVVTAEHDPLRDEGEHLAARLAEEGVVVTGVRFLGQLHGFWRHPDAFDAAEPLTRTIAGFLRSQHP